MKIKNVRIQNLRAFKDETIVFNDYTCLVGPNGAGKSTVLCALNMFFGTTSDSPVDLTLLEDEDFFQRDTSVPIIVTVTFCDLEPEAKKDFEGYYRHGELVVSACAVFNLESRRAEVRQYGQRMAMKAFAPFFKATGDGAKVADLAKIYTEIMAAVPELPKVKTKDAMADALREFETKHPDKCELIPSEDEFYGATKGANRLEKYIQWVFVPAVKDATTEQTEGKNTALAKLLERTVRSKANFDDDIKALRTKAQDDYKVVLAKNQNVLDGISASLKSRLSHWAHPEANLRLQWSQDFEKAVRVDDPFAEIIAGEGKFEGKLARFGHGFQRSYLLALLQELSGSGDAAGPRLILAVEEPELYQHPPQARHLAEVLKDLSTKNSQVMICTHSPFFVSGEGFEDVRVIRKDKPDSAAKVSSVSFAQLAKTIADAKNEAQAPKPEGILVKINQELQPYINEILFTPFLVLVEGLEDIAYLTTYFHLMDKWSDYRRLGCHMVACNGKSLMIQPLGIVKHLKVPTFAVFDSDGDKPDNGGSRVKHEKDNLAILKLCDIAGATAFPADNFWAPNVAMWKSDMGSVVQGDIPTGDLTKYFEAARKNCGHVAGLEKNSIFIAEWLTLAWQAGHKSATLLRLCEEILKAPAALPAIAVAAPAAAVAKTA